MESRTNPDVARLFGSAWAARTDLEANLESVQSLQIELLTETAHYPPVEVRHWRPGQRCPSRSLVAAQDPAEIGAKLAA